MGDWDIHGAEADAEVADSKSEWERAFSMVWIKALTSNKLLTLTSLTHSGHITSSPLQNEEQSQIFVLI